MSKAIRITFRISVILIFILRRFLLSPLTEASQAVDKRATINHVDFDVVSRAIIKIYH